MTEALEAATAPHFVRVAAAQSVSIPGDWRANLASHRRLIQGAAEHGVEVLLFPELSLCGYVLPHLRLWAPEIIALAVPEVLRLSLVCRMTVIVGVPWMTSDGGVQIASLVARSDGTSVVYAKRYLHQGEEQHVVPGVQETGLFRHRDATLSLAICAEASVQAHAQAAALAGSSIHMASVLVSPQGYEHDAGQLESHARTHGFAVLMANHGAPSGPFRSAGQSAFWGPSGDLLARAPASGESLVVATRSSNSWSAFVADV